LIAAYEDLIIGRLRSTLPAIDTQPLPLEPDELGYPVTESQIYVAFESESFQPVGGGMSDRSCFHQGRTLRYQLILRLLDLYGQQRSYGVLDIIREALTGATLPKLSRTGLYQVDGGYKRYADGLWLYQMRFEVPVVYAINKGDV
jgi:Gp37 protein